MKEITIKQSSISSSLGLVDGKIQLEPSYSHSKHRIRFPHDLEGIIKFLR